MKKLGKYLQQTRLNAGLSQAQVAKEANYTTPQFVSNIERGLIVPSPHFIAVFCKMTGTSRKEIVSQMTTIYSRNLSTAINGHS